VPQSQPKRRRRRLTDGNRIRLCPCCKDPVWSYDFMHSRTRDGRAFRLLTLIDEYGRECLSIDVGRKLNSQHVLDRLSELFVSGGLPTTFAVTTARNSPRGRSAAGSNTWEYRNCTLNPAVPERTGTLRASTAGSEMSCCTWRSSTHCWKQKPSLRGGVRSTIRSGPTVRWAIDRQHRKPGGSIHSRGIPREWTHNCSGTNMTTGTIHGAGQ
jgi:hypothetical protein